MRPSKWLDGLLAVLAITSAALVLGGQIGRVSEYADLCNAGLAVFVPVLIVIAAVAAMRRNRLVMGLALAGTLIGAAQLGMAILGTAPRAALSPDAIRILTFNIFHDNGQPDALPGLLLRSRPDLVLLQESDGTAAAQLVTAMPGFYRLRSCSGERCSLTILSRWPLSRIILPAPIPIDGLPDLLVADVRKPSGRFRVVTLHLPRPTEGEISVRHRAMLVDTLRRLRDAPLIVGGDFNLATGSFALARFQGANRLARADRLIPTYPADSILPPLAAIDHLFVDTNWTTSGCTRLPRAGSDHRGIVCGVTFSPPRK